MPYPRAPRTLVVALTLLLTHAARAAELPPTLSGTLTNPAGQTLTFGNLSAPATLTMNNASALINNGDWDAYAGIITPADGSTTTPAITNNGTLTVDAPNDILRITDFPGHAGTISMAFTNTGTVNVNAGALYLATSDTGNTTGDFHVAAGATLGINGRFSFDANSSLTGDGNLLISPEIRDYPNITTAGYTDPLPFALVFNGNVALAAAPLIDRHVKQGGGTKPP